jgi:uncharacterized membrane protein
MEDKNQAIRDLHEKIAELARKQKGFQEEIQRLQNAVFELDLGERPSVHVVTEQPRVPIQKTEIKVSSSINTTEEIKIPQVITPPPVGSATPAGRTVTKKDKTPWEEFIGTNLLNKVGIAILVIGIGFGVKYSIDHDLMGPITRVLLGYLSAVALIVLAIRLKKAHANFSAVLLSGGMAVLYFITYAAYDSYGLFPQTMAFILMVVFTAFTVFAAVQYDMQVIGIIGLVGAYAVPFLLSDGSGRVGILFSYVSIINLGILTLAFKKYWKKLYYLAFVLTWLIFGAWHLDRYNENEHLVLSLVFSTVFFITFYVTFLSYKLIRKEPLSKPDLFIMLLNSFIFYGFGYATIDYAEGGDEFLGLFTLATAVIHFIACFIIYKQQTQFRDIFYFVAGMVLVFLTLAVPVQLEGNWVTLVWAAEASLLFWIGRTKRFPVYEKLSYPLVALAAASLTHDWEKTYLPYYLLDSYQETQLTLFLNIQFLTSLLVVSSFTYIFLLNRNSAFVSPWSQGSIQEKIVTYSISALTVLVLYLGIFKEVEYFWSQKYAASVISVHNEYGAYEERDNNVLSFRNLWLINYSAIFALALSLSQLYLFRKKELMIVSLLINAAVVFAFVTVGLYELSVLRSSYLADADNAYFIRDTAHIIIRYVGIMLIVPLLFINYRYVRNELFPENMRQVEKILMHITVLILLSSELVHWLEMARMENSFKLGLSILWGAYALFLIVLGLKREQKHLRVSAMILFGVTLVKLFVYDMEDMSTISKTIVMIVLGILLLVSSFLYNKLKKTVGNEIQ